MTSEVDFKVSSVTRKILHHSPFIASLDSMVSNRRTYTIDRECLGDFLDLSSNRIRYCTLQDGFYSDKSKER